MTIRHRITTFLLKKKKLIILTSTAEYNSLVQTDNIPPEPVVTDKRDSIKLSFRPSTISSPSEIVGHIYGTKISRTWKMVLHIADVT
jgi:hypothetical protein